MVSLAGKWIKLEIIMLNETNQTQKQNNTKPCPMSYFTCEIQDVSTCVHVCMYEYAHM